MTVNKVKDINFLKMLKKKIITKITGIKEIIELGEGKSTILRMMTRKRGHLKTFIKVS